MTPSTDSSGISQTLKRGIIIAHDLVATALAFGGCLILRYQFWQLAPMLDEIVRIMPCFVLVAGIVYRIFPLYASKWRFASLPDLFNIFKAASLLSVLMLAGDYVLVARNLSPWLMFGEKTVVIYWLLQMFLLGGPRLAYRYLKYVQSRRVGDRENVSSVLVLGRATEAEVVLRALETGMRRRFVARAILSPQRSDYGTSIRNVPVLGNYAELERIVSEAQDGNQPITRIIFAPNEFLPESESEMLLATANRLGIPLSRMQAIEEGTIVKAALKPVAIEDLLFRPSVEVDRTMLADLMHGKRAIVTGGGGSIGSEICARLVAFGISELLILDHSEPALYNILETLAPLCTATVTLSGKIADVRDRERIFGLFRDFKPDLVFHAAALKQVPFLEIDWTEGDQDQRLRQRQYRRCGRTDGERRRADLDRQGRRSRFGARGHEAALRDLCAAARRRGRSRAEARAALVGALRQRARIGRFRRSEVQGADRARWARDGHASRNGALLHDGPRGLRSRSDSLGPRARPQADEHRTSLRLRAEDGSTGPHRRSCDPHDPHGRLRAGTRHGDRLHGHPEGRAAQRGAVHRG